MNTQELITSAREALAAAKVYTQAIADTYEIPFSHNSAQFSALITKIKFAKGADRTVPADLATGARIQFDSEKLRTAAEDVEMMVNRGADPTEEDPSGRIPARTLQLALDSLRRELAGSPALPAAEAAPAPTLAPIPDAAPVVREGTVNLVKNICDASALDHIELSGLLWGYIHSEQRIRVVCASNAIRDHDRYAISGLPTGMEWSLGRNGYCLVMHADYGSTYEITLENILEVAEVDEAAEEVMEQQVRAWADMRDSRDDLFRQARAAGLSKATIAALSGVARSTIDRIPGLEPEA